MDTSIGYLVQDRTKKLSFNKRPKILVFELHVFEIQF